VQNEVEIGILACNTLHLYMQRLPTSSIPFLSLPHTILEKAMENKHHRLLMLGTENTCHSSLYRHPGITILYPHQKEQQLIDEVIDRLLEGKVCQKDAISISRMIVHLADEMAFDGVILGCTDLPVLHHHFPIHADKPFYDSIKVPAKILRGIFTPSSGS
jgi:aspartate racemase